ncbi:hypothetical protein BJY00DRAFT_201193 [Aspergillus carlsbadensis]|nr:hypothetical protein BJY00DRAFT_201193 [Aspergillus carlsbadensis]
MGRLQLGLIPFPLPLTFTSRQLAPLMCSVDHLETYTQWRCAKGRAGLEARNTRTGLGRRAKPAHLAGGLEEQKLLKEVQVKTSCQDMNPECSRLTFSPIQWSIEYRV